MKTRLLAVCILLTGVSAGTVKNGPVSKLEAHYLSNETGLYLPEDLEATLWAESPKFFNPTNIDVDIKGRIWVTEAVNYRLYNKNPTNDTSKAAGDRVMILEDKDGDGVAETSKVFVQDKDLVAPLGISVLGNKVIVSSAPSVIVYTDENGDDKPDKKEIFLTGFGGFDHDHSLHAMFAGPDGKFYFNAGNAGPHIVTDKSGWTLRSGSIYNGGSPYNKNNKGGLVSDDGKMWVGGIAMRVNPDGTGLKVLGHNFRNSYELTLDSFGNIWQNDNDDDGNKGVRVSWLMEGANMGYASSDGTRNWQADRRPGQSTIAAHWHQEDPGVLPIGDNTGAGSPTGIAFNESDLLGEKYRGMLLSCEAGRNVVLSYYPRPEGAGYDLKRKNFITSLNEDEVENANSVAKEEEKTKSFRPSDVVIGADGAIYVADWYDSMVGAHRMTNTSGRIYRITPKGKKLAIPKINLKTTSGQISALLSPAVNVRNAGFVLLAAKGDNALKDVKKILASTNPYHRARATWLMANMGPKGITEVENLLKDNDPDLRITAFRALREVKPDILPYALQLSNDPSAAVRRDVALALRDLPFDKIKEIVVNLSRQYDGKDRFYLEALGTAMTDKEEDSYPLLLSRLGDETLNWSPAFADLTWRLHPKSAIVALTKRAETSQLTNAQRQKAIVTLGFIKDQHAVDAMAGLLANNEREIKDQALWWLRYRKANEWSNFKMPASLNEKPSTAGSKAQQEMLVPKNTLLANGGDFNTKVNAAKAMAKDKTGGEMLIGLAAEKKLTSEMVTEISKVIFANPDQSVRVLAGDYFQNSAADIALSIPDIAKIPGDAAKGKIVFQNKCTACHRVDKTGNDIGPALSAIGKKYEKNGLLDAIINPSAGMAFGYESWLITRKDGSIVSGFLRADGETVVIKGMDGQMFNIKASDIATRKQFATSIMPEPAALGLNQMDLANLSTYLLTLKAD